MPFEVDLNEQLLVDGIRKGDRSAMRNAYEAYSGYLRAVCSRYIPEDAQVDDILQDSFIKIFTSIDKFSYRGNGALRAWMTRLCINESLQYLRKNKRHKFEELDTMRDIPDDSDGDESIEDIKPEVLQQMIKSLPDGYRIVFNLFVFEEKSHKEIADILHITESTSASQFFRARKLLCKKIQEYRAVNR